MTTVLDSPEVMLLLTLLATGLLCGTWVVVLVIRRVLQLVVTAGADDDQVLVVVAAFSACVTGEACPGGRWGLKVRLGRGLPSAVTTKAISLVVELGRVARERIGIHWEGGHGNGSNELDVSFAGVVDGLCEQAGE